MSFEAWYGVIFVSIVTASACDGFRNGGGDSLKISKAFPNNAESSRMSLPEEACILPVWMESWIAERSLVVSIKSCCRCLFVVSLLMMLVSLLLSLLVESGRSRRMVVEEGWTFAPGEYS